MRYLYLFVALFVLCISAVNAVPITLPATAVGNNNVTLNGNGVTGSTGWFQVSMATGLEYAHYPNVTANAGVISYTMKGTPLFGSTAYYFVACDPTGCGAEQTFTTAPVTQLPVPMINGVAIDSFGNNLTENAMEPQNAVWNAMQPYIAISTDTIFYGLIFALVFVGMWLRTRGTQTATIFGMMCIGLFGVTGGLLGTGVLPGEFIAAGQAFLYLSLTGAILAFTFK
jgi:hypothetical protein